MTSFVLFTAMSALIRLFHRLAQLQEDKIAYGFCLNGEPVVLISKICAVLSEKERLNIISLSCASA